MPDIEHHLKIMTFNKIEKFFSTRASLRYHRVILYKNLTTGYYLAHSSRVMLNLLISFRLSLSKPQSIM